ncbi:DMT family transporter [Anaerolentibacter hominis]|uniref:DMT family transporter n=1 Tax=Anaerolentibacter hominis TaxID=3079009 RepID=UPI0031B81015
MKKYGLLVLLALIWSTHFTVLNIANKAVHPFVVGMTIRFLTFLLLTVAIVKTGEIKKLFSIKGVWWKLILIGILGYLLDATSFMGFQVSDANTGTILLKTDVLMANITSVIIFKEKFTKKDWLFTITMLAGVAMILGINPLHLKFDAGSIFFILSAFFVTMNAFTIKSVQHSEHKVSNNIIAYYNNFITMLLFLASSLIIGVQGEVKTLFTSSNIGVCIAIGGVMQFLIYMVYYICLDRFPVWIVKVFLLLIPLFTLVYSMILFGQMPGISHLIGTLIIIASAVGIICEQKNKSAAAEPAS